MTKGEMYDWYVDNCCENEIPLSKEEWEREIYPADKKLWALINRK